MNLSDQSDLSSDEENLTASQAENNGTTETRSPVPQKSKYIYEKAYSEYFKWCSTKNVQNCYTEKSLLAYFFHLSKIRKPSSLWSYYSMLKVTLKIKDSVDISSYSELFSFLKRKFEGYKPKKAKAFTEENVETFLYEAPDDIYLMMKVVLIFGLSGVYCRQDLVNLEKDNIEELQSSLLITLRDIKSKRSRIFRVVNTQREPSLLGFYKKYADLRPPNTESGRFFLFYRNGRCTRQVVGKNTFSEIPKKIASYLKLPSPESYTGHSFRQSSATLGNTGRRWKSSNVCEKFIEDSPITEKLPSQQVDSMATYDLNFSSMSSVSYQDQDVAKIYLKTSPKQEREEGLDTNDSNVLIKHQVEVSDENKLNVFIKPEVEAIGDENKFNLNCAVDLSLNEIKYEENLMVTEAEISEIAEEARSFASISKKTKYIYEKNYGEYIKWCHENNMQDCYIEENLLKYFEHLSKIRKPSSLWNYYSMLKATLKMNHNVDMAGYSRLLGFLKRKYKNYTPKKAKVFTEKDVETFLYESPDDIYLMMKVALIFGFSGACRRQELVYLKKDNIQELQSSLIITLRDNETKTYRMFTVVDNHKKPSFLEFYKKYADLRPPNTESRRFFLLYKNGKCNRQVVGKNSFGEIPKKIATYLKLPNPELYSTHSFRHLSSNVGAGRKSTSISGQSIESSVSNKGRNTENMISQNLSAICEMSISKMSPLNYEDQSSVAKNEEELFLKQESQQEVEESSQQRNEKFDIKNSKMLIKFETGDVDEENKSDVVIKQEAEDVGDEDQISSIVQLNYWKH